MCRLKHQFFPCMRKNSGHFSATKSLEFLRIHGQNRRSWRHNFHTGGGGLEKYLNKTRVFEQKKPSSRRLRPLICTGAKDQRDKVKKIIFFGTRPPPPANSPPQKKYMFCTKIIFYRTHLLGGGVKSLEFLRIHDQNRRSWRHKFHTM